MLPGRAVPRSLGALHSAGSYQKKIIMDSSDLDFTEEEWESARQIEIAWREGFRAGWQAARTGKEEEDQLVPK